MKKIIHINSIALISLNIKFICTRCETGMKSSPKARYSAFDNLRFYQNIPTRQNKLTGKQLYP
jgi:hypothetical protein